MAGVRVRGVYLRILVELLTFNIEVTSHVNLRVRYSRNLQCKPEATKPYLQVRKPKPTNPNTPE